MNYLHNFDFNYYKPTIDEDDWIYLDEIEKLRDSINIHIERKVLNV